VSMYAYLVGFIPVSQSGLSRERLVRAFMSYFAFMTTVTAISNAIRKCHSFFLSSVWFVMQTKNCDITRLSSEKYEFIIESNFVVRLPLLVTSCIYCSINCNHEKCHAAMLRTLTYNLSMEGALTERVNSCEIIDSERWYDDE
jgi:hypothetical protein